MKSMISLSLLIILAFVSIAQGALTPPVDSETSTLVMDSQESRFVADMNINPAVMFAKESQTISKTLELRSDGYTLSVLPVYRTDQMAVTTTAEMKYDVSDIDVGVSITKADTPVMLTPDNQRLTPSDARLTVEPSKQSPTIATYNYLPGYVGWCR